MACSSSAAATGWSVVASPNRPGFDYLSGVSCVSSSACVAVGYSDSASVPDRTLVETWNGRTWSITPSPNVGAEPSDLNSVYCSAPGACWAVGTKNVYASLIERLVGHRWTVVNSSRFGHTTLTGVTCIHRNDCVAVGWQSFQSLALKWDGGAWFVWARFKDVGLNGISCPTPTLCMAVGHRGQRPMVETWDGSAWSSSKLVLLHSSLSEFDGVTCWSARGCMSVGEGSAKRAIAAIWNGRDWTALPVPLGGVGQNSLKSVACRSAADCVAVGSSSVLYGGAVGFMEKWDGSTWRVVIGPHVDGAVLSGVAMSRGHDFAVGNGPRGTLIERWERSASAT